MEVGTGFACVAEKGNYQRYFSLLEKGPVISSLVASTSAVGQYTVSYFGTDVVLSIEVGDGGDAVKLLPDQLLQ